MVQPLREGGDKGLVTKKKELFSKIEGKNWGYWTMMADLRHFQIWKKCGHSASGRIKKRTLLLAASLTTCLEDELKFTAIVN